jgi:hypothetical protein
MTSSEASHLLPLKTPEALLKGERIARGRTGRGVVEDAPDGAILSQLGQLLREALDLAGAVFGIIHRI